MIYFLWCFLKIWVFQKQFLPEFFVCFNPLLKKDQDDKQTGNQGDFFIYFEIVFDTTISFISNIVQVTTYFNLNFKCLHQFITTCLFIGSSWREIGTRNGAFKRQKLIWPKGLLRHLLRLLPKIVTWREWDVLQGALNIKWNWKNWWRGGWEW